MSDVEDRCTFLRKTFADMPQQHRDCLEFLMFHLARVAKREPENLVCLFLSFSRMVFFFFSSIHSIRRLTTSRCPPRTSRSCLRRLLCETTASRERCPTCTPKTSQYSLSSNIVTASSPTRWSDTAPLDKGLGGKKKEKKKKNDLCSVAVWHIALVHIRKTPRQRLMSRLFFYFARLELSRNGLGGQRRNLSILMTPFHSFFLLFTLIPVYSV